MGQRRFFDGAQVELGSIPLVASAPAVFVRVSGAWVQATAVFVRVSGAWVEAAALYVRVSSAWVQLQ